MYSTPSVVFISVSVDIICFSPSVVDVTTGFVPSVFDPQEVGREGVNVAVIGMGEVKESISASSMTLSEIKDSVYDEVIDINEENGTLFGTSIGAGYKLPSTNAFTGILMGANSAHKRSEIKKSGTM